MQNSPLDDILSRLHSLQDELEHEIDRILDEKRQLFRYTLEQGKVQFEHGMKVLQRTQRTGIWAYLRHARVGHILSAPIIYSVSIPLLMLDLMITIYQHSCFRIYGIPLVRRSDYFRVDHQHLAYLNIIERANCIYCSYGNGLIEYGREIIARTEKYWCPIKHAKRTPDPHHLVDGFVDYGDAEAYKDRLKVLQSDWSQLRDATSGNGEQ
ncbi:MAG: hypothetical protein GY753_14675 [Gammaproteobacteria bacterium]|nr:hypothetical protein [Gammaproteobacteria bacterium]